MLKDEAKKALKEAVTTARTMGVAVTPTMTNDHMIHLLVVVCGGEGGLKQTTLLTVNACDAESIEAAYQAIRNIIVVLRNYRRECCEAIELFDALK